MSPQYKAVIFDLDMTLVDSRCIAHHRARYQWKKVLKKVDQIEPYEGIIALLKELKRQSIPTAIVTSGINDYCDAVIKECGLPIKTKVAYHDTKKHKPDPEPLLMASNLLKVAAKSIVAIGDRYDDVTAARGAGMISVAAMWGCTSHNRVREEKPDYECATVEELIELLELKNE